MSVLTDLKNELQAYGPAHLTVAIESVTFPGALSAPNIGEVGTFIVRVQNTGELGATNLRLRIEGLNGNVMLSLSNTVPFATSITTPPCSVGAVGHLGQLNLPGQIVLGPFYAKAEKLVTNQPLFRATVVEHDLTLDHLLQRHPAAGGSNQYVGTIYP